MVTERSQRVILLTIRVTGQLSETVHRVSNSDLIWMLRGRVLICVCFSKELRREIGLSEMDIWFIGGMAEASGILLCLKQTMIFIVRMETLG